ncbi:MAG: PQQ-dependent sugar dehydrogenase, partial [Verrucomicrobiota bacterium]|nr:PQQ-dependent sugar dehydrogenase [Verrucomicrobiota bacterium]
MNILHLLTIAVIALASAGRAAAEPWVDERLPVREGLVLWLDAAKLNPARAARRLAELAPGAPIDHWPDASGEGRDPGQVVHQSRPSFQTTPAGAFVRFDGSDDFLTTAKLGSDVPEATLFLVARARSNAGGFRAFASANGAGLNDYRSGFNIDLGAKATTGFDVLNAEGAGFAGQRNLLARPVALGMFHVIALQFGTGEDGVRAFVDGERRATRRRAAARIRMDQFTLGARYSSNEAKPPYVQGFLDGDIAEVLLFGRSLSDAEQGRVSSYLSEKHSPLMTIADAAEGKPLVPVQNPPLVQMLVPGFSVRELSIALTHINCLRYRPDGKLVAGAYNGKIWLLSDTDDDGLEDKADLFWESADLKNVIGMAVTPAGDPRGEGVFVATAGRILFVRDKDRDGRGDEQIIVASGWEKQAAPGGGGSVDALGLTLAPDGSIFFALGTSAYNNAYLLDKDGRAHYRLESERGTILRIAPDFSKREVVCTGIRYPVGAAFNRLGDLFVTEQEGATWLPNGNAFDELLHIQPGRHYGFPPRHPKHLPNVIDEPSVFDYGPQHQSTCGFAFNEPVNGGPTFGPAWWAGDALVTGESRGKLWRTKLAKTSAGYVAQTHLIASLTMLTVDVALSPRGDLVVACHSGRPDWGTGPEGAGKLFKITHSARDAPQPALAWSSGPGELR